MDSLKLLNQFYEAVEKSCDKGINNIGTQIINLGKEKYPASVLASIESIIDKSSKKILDIYSIFDSMKDDDKFVAKKIMPMLDIGEPTQKSIPDNYKAFNKKEENIKQMWLSRPKELSLKCKPEFNAIFYQQALESPEKARCLKITYQKYAGDGDKIIGFRLLNELSPVYFHKRQINGINKEGLKIDFEFIPFPSLMRNGTHYSELVSYEPNQENLHALHKYHYHIFNGCAENKIDNINIMPQIKDSRCSRLNKDWEKWLEDIQGVKVTYVNSNIGGNIALSIVEYSYPTFAALIGGCEQNKTNKKNNERDILVADNITYTPLYRYRIKTNTKILSTNNDPNTQYPKCETENGLSFKGYKNLPICIHTNMLKSIDKDIPDNDSIGSSINIQVVVNIEDIDKNSIRLFLFTLMNQKEINLKNIILYTQYKVLSELANELSEEYSFKSIISCNRDTLKENINPEHIVLFSSQHILLRKENTIKRLVEHLDSEIITSVSCKINHVEVESEKIKDRKSSSGQLIKRIKKTEETNYLELETSNSFNQIHGTCYNVIANNHDFTLISGREIINSSNQINDMRTFITELTLDFIINAKINIVDTTIDVYNTNNKMLGCIVIKEANRVKKICENWETYNENISDEIQLYP